MCVLTKDKKLDLISRLAHRSAMKLSEFHESSGSTKPELLRET